jgi:peptide/nickel transport system substrate-binding protein
MILGVFAGCAPQQPTTGTPAAGVAKYKEHINIGIDSQITTIDPMLNNNNILNILFNMTHNTLIGYNFKTKEYEPELALSWKWVDDKTLELILRQGVVFQDGTTFNAEDVKATLGRASNGLVTGSYDYSEIIDDYTIRTVIKAPNVDWISTLASNVSAITSKEAFEKTPEAAHTGTGPWAVSSFIAGDSINLSRNENYWGILPITKSITLRYYGEAAARLVALENNEMDLILSVSATDLPNAQANKEIVVDAFTSTNTIYFCFNTDKEPGDDINLRKAVAYAINRSDIIDGVGDTNGKPATTFWGWDSYGYFDKFDLDLSYNPTKSKEYAALAKSKSFTINTSSFNNFNLISQVLQDQLRKVGIEMTIQEMDSAGLASSTKWGSTHESVIYSIALNPSGSDMFRLIAYGTAGNRANVMDKNDPLYTLQTASVGATDDAERKEYLKQLQTVMHDQVYFIPLYYASANVAYRKGIENPGVQNNKVYEFAYIQFPIK